MKFSNKTTLTFVLIAATIVVVLFVSAFPSKSKRDPSSLADIADDIDASSPSLRGSASKESEVFSESELFVADKENVGATLNPSDIVTEPHYLKWMWDDLPENIQDAATKLDYTKELWDKGDSFPFLNQDWSELTREQKDAAKEVGYNRRKWNNQDKAELSSSTGSPTSEASTFAYYYAQFVWADLTPEARSAAEYLGYSEQMWDTSQYLPLLQTKWNDLSDTQRAAAETLGYDREIWNHASRYL